MKAGELVGRDLSGWKIQKIFTPELAHSLMGFFPVIFPEDPDTFVVTLSRELAERVVSLLPDRRHKIGERFALVNERKMIALDVFGDSSPWGFEGEYQREESPILSLAGFTLRMKDVNLDPKFKWAPGLVSAR